MKPKPVVVETICSECGMDWDLHGENPTTSDCIRLLRAELAIRPRSITIQPYVQPYSPAIYPWWGQTYCGTNTADYRLPAIEATCSAVSA